MSAVLNRYGFSDCERYYVFLHWGQNNTSHRSVVSQYPTEDTFHYCCDTVASHNFVSIFSFSKQVVRTIYFYLRRKSNHGPSQLDHTS